LVAPPPLIVAPTTPGETKFTEEPPTIFGASLVLFCTVIAPARFSEVIAYGIGVICCLGVNVVKLPLPLGSTAISSQLLLPSNAVPKSISVVNKPLLTLVALFVTGPAMATPVTLVLN
jgi:hypothetical protein